MSKEGGIGDKTKGEIIGVMRTRFAEIGKALDDGHIRSFFRFLGLGDDWDTIEEALDEWLEEERM